MQCQPLHIKGYGYLNNILESDQKTSVHMVCIQSPFIPKQDAEALWLECDVDTSIGNLLKPYLSFERMGKSVVVNFTATLGEHCDIDKVHNMVTCHADLLSIHQIFVDGQLIS